MSKCVNVKSETETCKSCFNGWNGQNSMVSTQPVESIAYSVSCGWDPGLPVKTEPCLSAARDTLAHAIKPPKS